MSAKNITPLERNISIVAVLLGLIFLIPFLFSKCSYDYASGFMADNDSKESTTEEVIDKNLPATSVAQTTLKEKLDQAYGMNDVLQAELTDTRNQLYKLKEDIKTVDTTTNETEPPLAVAAAVVAAPIVSSNNDNDIQLLEDQISNLELQNSKLTKNSNQEIQKLTGDVSDLTKSNKELKTKVKSLQTLIDKDFNIQRDKKIDETIAKLRIDNTSLRFSIQKMAAQAKQAEKLWQQKLTVKTEQLTTKNAELKRALDKHKAENSLASAESDPQPSFSKLFERLQKLEGSSADELTSAYDNIKSTLKSESSIRIKFKSDSNTLDEDDRVKIKALINDTQTSDSFLIVGYASKYGDKALNEKLSLKRAKSTTTNLLNQLQSDHAVQVVYMGETTRFGKSSENQCVEIWRIAK